MNKKINGNIDQMSVTFPCDCNSDLDHTAIHLAQELHLFDLYGNPFPGTPINGYAKAFDWLDNDIRLCYSPDEPSRRLFLHLTATGLRRYLEDLHDFGQNLDAVDLVGQMDKMSGQFTRMDVEFDFINLGLSVNQLHDLIKDQKVQVRNKKGHLVDFKGIFEENDDQTMYFGSGKSDKFLRVYDKKVEQLGKDKAFFAVALSCENWIRVEGEFKHSYATRIAHYLAHNIKKNHQALLAKILLESWDFMGDWTAINELNKIVNNNQTGQFDFHYLPEEKLITRLIRHHLNDGAAGDLYKIYRLFGKQGLIEFQGFLYKYVINADHDGGYRIPRNTERNIKNLQPNIKNKDIHYFIFRALQNLGYWYPPRDRHESEKDEKE